MKKKQQNTPSASVEAEQAVLGGLMLSPDAWLRAGDVVEPEHFFRQDHRFIFAAIAALASAKKPCDPVTVAEHLDRQGSLKESGGLAYLGTLTRDTPGAANVRRYAEIVFERWQTRRAVDIAEELAETAAHEEKAVDTAVQSLMALSHRATTNDGLLSTSSGSFMDELDDRCNPAIQTWIKTGLPRLDAKIGGFGKGDLIVIAGRPSMGKTALALNIVAANLTRPGGMMSGEQPRNQLIGRMASILTGINGNHMRLGKMDDADWALVTTALVQLRDMPLYVNDKPSPDNDLITRQARKWKHYHDIQYLVSDYLQRFEGPGKERHSQVEAITRSHKQIARELDIPVILLSQIGRGVESRPDKRPMMSDLRDSGAIEQEADTILTLYRDEVYYGVTPGREGEVEIAALKNRHGPLGVIGCRFNAPCVRFEDYEFGARGDPGPGSEDLPFDSPRRGNGTDERPVENRRGPYRRSTPGG